MWSGASSATTKAVTNGDGDSTIRLMIFVRRIGVWPMPPMPPPQRGWGDRVVEGAWSSLMGLRVGEEEREDFWTLSWARRWVEGGEDEGGRGGSP